MSTTDETNDRIALEIPGEMPSLNDYIRAERTSRFAGAAMKREWTATVAWYAKSAGLRTITVPVMVSFTWIDRTARRDPDNVRGFGAKAILDGLVAAGVLPDDSRKWIHGLHDVFAVDPTNPRVVVEIQEIM